MMEHWYEALPAAWFVDGAGWWVLASVALIAAGAFCAGWLVGFRAGRHGR